MKKLTRKAGTSITTELTQGEISMTHIDCDMLVYQYPTIRNFILECFELGEETKIIDFLFSIETEQPQHKGH